MGDNCEPLVLSVSLYSALKYIVQSIYSVKCFVEANSPNCGLFSRGLRGILGIRLQVVRFGQACIFKCNLSQHLSKKHKNKKIAKYCTKTQTAVGHSATLPYGKK